MNNRSIEKLIVGALSSISALRGIYAIVTADYQSTSKFGVTTHLVGAHAQYAGLMWLGIGGVALAGLLYRLPNGKYYFVLALCLASLWTGVFAHLAFRSS